MSLNERSNVIAIALMVFVAALGAIDAVIVRLVTPSVHPFIIGFTRSLFGLLAVLPWIITHPGILKSSYRSRHMLRAALKLASLILFFMAYAVAQKVQEPSESLPYSLVSLVCLLLSSQASRLAYQQVFCWLWLVRC